MSDYIIITPAFNEAGYIDRTIESVIVQQIIPKQWIIVDDGSTDSTADVIKNYAVKYDWIQYYYRQKPEGQAYFSSNVFAIMEGWNQVKEIQFKFLAILDADIVLPVNYYAEITRRLDQDTKLGIASGVYENLIDGKLYPVLNDRRSTPKALQVFQKSVFESIGGYLPLEHGGEDTVSCFVARMQGWKVWSYPDIKAQHLRPTGTGNANTLLKVRFKQGICEYHLAVHPFFLLIKALRRMIKERPYILGGFARIWGFLWAALKRHKTVLPSDVISYIRKDQLYRIRHFNKVPEIDQVTPRKRT
ncbi:glycosyltransferase [Planctomycetota bacterium]